VSDIMRTGEKLATVPPTATVMETVMAMTAAKGGSAIIVDADGKLAGIFTDGDFRRIIGKTEGKGQETKASVDCLLSSVLESPISEFMTRSPLFVRDDAYAAELLKIFERKRIDDLPVCDAEGKAVGLVDLQDLPKMKVI